MFDFLATRRLTNYVVLNLHDDSNFVLLNLHDDSMLGISYTMIGYLLWKLIRHFNLQCSRVSRSSNLIASPLRMERAMRCRHWVMCACSKIRG